MATSYATRTLNAYFLHGHVGTAPVEDYAKLFKVLDGIDPKERIRINEGRVLAVRQTYVSKTKFAFDVSEGDLGISPIIFNTLSQEERIEQLEKGEVIVTKTHGAVDFSTRNVVIEYNHRGAKADDIFDYFTELLLKHTALAELNLELVPVPGTGFIEAVESLKRIRAAEVRIVKPNIDWTDAEDALTDLAGDSGAQNIDLQLSAPRNGSLERDSGIIKTLKETAQKGLKIFKKAVIRGNMNDAKVEEAVSLEHYQDNRKKRYRKSSDGHIDSGQIQAEITSYIGDLNKTNKGKGAKESDE